MIAIGEVTRSHLVNFIDTGDDQGCIADDFEAEFRGQSRQVQRIAQLHGGLVYNPKIRPVLSVLLRGTKPDFPTDISQRLLS